MGRSKGFAAAPIAPGLTDSRKPANDGNRRRQSRWKQCLWIDWWVKERWPLPLLQPCGDLFNKTICCCQGNKAHPCAREAVTWHPCAIWWIARVPAAKGESAVMPAAFLKSFPLSSSIIPFSISVCDVLIHTHCYAFLFNKMLSFQALKFYGKSFPGLNTLSSASKKTGSVSTYLTWEKTIPNAKCGMLSASNPSHKFKDEKCLKI